MNTQEAYLSAFQRAYINTALWSSTDDDDVALDRDHTPEDIHADTYAAMENDCKNFVAEHWDDLKDLDPAQCGVDLYIGDDGMIHAQ